MPSVEPRKQVTLVEEIFLEGGPLASQIKGLDGLS
jgi:hypothetical protein